MASQDSQLLLQLGDLVEDREVADVDSDRLAHAQIAAQLGELVRTVSAPSNIALYGPWGSGKSGIGNLLRKDIGQDNKMRFARFDAFKFAEAPLRRNFVSAVATDLGITADAFHNDLYTGRTRTDVKVPAGRIFKILGVFAILTLGLSGILVGVVALIALFQTGAYGADFSILAKGTVTAGLLPAALLSALITLANRTFQVDRTTGKPDSDEQFEHIFKDLVNKSNADRLVIFVDELDRCAPDEVVATLDAVRTFLGVPKCIFIIAADQRVLEESLTRKARQETPVDEVNPYYSTGSAYLDKVFQYQISLPPLMSQRITRFAADLVKGRGGLWAEINSDYVISVLVPTHVVSPRRVKHLINTFALAYRLAQERNRRGLLAEDPTSQASSLARLVCLSVEFPLFARDLEIDARLPQMVLQLVADVNEKFDSSYSEQAMERARAYAGDGALATTMIVETDEDDDGVANQLTATNNRQLLDYLRRTKTVHGPSRDLVFMHSSGTAFGLDGETSIAIEAAAETADAVSVIRRLEGADLETRKGVVNLLNELMRTSIGVGGPNAARTLLGVYATDGNLPIESIADSASEMIASFIDDDPNLIDDQTIDPAWRLASEGAEAGAILLREAILDRADENGQRLDTSFILRNPAPALAGNQEVFGRLVAREIVREAFEESVSLLEGLPPGLAIAVLAASSKSLASALSEAIEAKVATESAVVPPTAVGRLGVAAAAPSLPDVLDPQPIIDALADFAGRQSDANSALTHEVIMMLLRVDKPIARSAIEDLLPDTTPITRPEEVEAALEAVKKRDLALWPTWLTHIGPSSVNFDHGALIHELSTHLWVSAQGGDASSEATEDAVFALAGVVEQLAPEDRRTLTAEAIQDVQVSVTDHASANARSELFRLAMVFDAVGLISLGEVYSTALESLAGTFEVNFAQPIVADDGMGRYLLNDAVEIIRRSTLTDDDTGNAVEVVLAEVASCTSLPEPLRTEILLRMVEASRLPAADVNVVPSAEDLLAHIAAYGTSGASSVEIWLRLRRPSAIELATLYIAIREGRIMTASIVDAIVEVRSGWSREERLSFLRGHLASPESDPPNLIEARAIGLNDDNAADATDVIVDRYEATKNNAQRKKLVTILTVAQIHDSNSQRKLFESVVIPLLKPLDGPPQIGMTEIALDAIAALGPPPHGVKSALNDALKAAVGANDDLMKRATKTLEPLGWQTKSTGGLLGIGRKRTVKF